VRDTGSNVLTIEGTINSAPNSTIEIGFWRSASCDPSGSGEGLAPMTNGPSPLFVTVTTNALGDATFSRSGNFFLPANEFVTAVARRFHSVNPGLQVSEFSPCRQVVSVGPLIFADDFE
jgi:hypothetical protein